MIRVLFSSAGRRVELINCFRNAAKKLGVDIRIYALDIDPSWSPACKIADRAFSVLPCTEAGFINDVSTICDDHGVDLVIPTIDTELQIYAESRQYFAEKGVRVMVSTPETVAVTRDKAKTAEALLRHGVPVPRTWRIKDILESGEQVHFPMILKPKDGSCSSGIMTIDSMCALIDSNVDADHYIAQEKCSGQEYTVNAYYAPDGSCVACVPHFRRLVRSGEVCFAQTARIPEFSEIAKKIETVLKGIYGTICFQGFLDMDGDLRIFEINARFGGGYPICDRAGGTFARWILQETMGREPDYHDDWIDGLRMMRYDAAIFSFAE